MMVMVACAQRRYRCSWVATLLASLFLLNGSTALLCGNQPFLARSRTYVYAPHPLTVDATVANKAKRVKRGHRTHPFSTVALSGMWSQDDEIQGSDKIKACIPYLLPLMDGDHFGRFIYDRIPPLAALNEVTIGPLAELGHKIPFLSLGLFVALTLGTRFKTDMSRNLRFSAQQAALVDVALLFPELIGSGFEQDPVPRYIAEPCSNFVWYAYVSVVLYCIYSNLRGKKPDQIPFLSNSADLMVGPF